VRSYLTQRAWETLRRASLHPWRAINGTLDAIFYDIGALSSEERAGLSAFAGPEGSVLVVHPASRRRAIRSLSPWDFVGEQSAGDGEPVDAVAVAGVGSSALGTAALARNVADHLDRPVAAVVAGLGLSDVLAEAWGGWFVLGAANRLRDYLARAFDALELEDHVRDPTSHEAVSDELRVAAIERERFIYGSPDSTALLYLLLKLGPRLRLLVGHSKGNYSIANALEGWLSARRRAGAPAPRDLCVVTLGAVIRFPEELSDVHQFLGQADYFGWLNSRHLVDHVDVPGAWHSLNSLLPGHLSVDEALRRAGVA
jgi:hypothetical protein